MQCLPSKGCPGLATTSMSVSIGHLGTFSQSDVAEVDVRRVPRRPGCVIRRGPVMITNPLEYARFLSNNVVDGAEAGVSSAAIFETRFEAIASRTVIAISGGVIPERSASSRSAGIAKCAGAGAHVHARNRRFCGLSVLSNLWSCSYSC